MPAFSFKEQFAMLVEWGKKRQTLRVPRKRPTRVGETLFLYTGMRTKGCRLLKKVECLSVQSVEIDKHGQIFIDGELLGAVAMQRFAVADGFFSSVYFVNFFECHYGLPVTLDLIKW